MVVHLGDHPKNIGNIHVVIFQITRIPWESEFRSSLPRPGLLTFFCPIQRKVVVDKASFTANLGG